MSFDPDQWLILRKDAGFGQCLAKVYRGLRTDTQPNFARAHALHPKAVERIEQGRIANVSPEMFQRLAKAVGRSPTELIRLAQPTSHVSLALAAGDDPALRLLRRQENDILNVPLLPGERVSFRFIWPDLIFAAPVRYQRRPRGGTTDALELVDPGIADTAVIGVPGSGKSTALRLAALRFTRDYTRDHAKPFPLLMHARDVGDWFSGELGSKLFELGLSQAQPLARMIDGLDEVGEAQRLEVLKMLRHSARPGDVTVLTCRHDVFASLERQEPGHTNFDEVVEIVPWDFDTNVVPFATGYLEKVERRELAPIFIRACISSPNLRRFICNPFHLTLTLYLLQAGSALEADLFVDRYSLYHAFYRQWIARERRRGTSGMIEAARIIAGHVEVARRLYRRRVGADEASVEDYLAQHPVVASDSAFEDLFQWHYDELSDRMRVMAFRHETLLEFILAFGLVESMIGGTGLEQALLTQYNNDVNSFVRERFSRLSRPECRAVEDRLTRLLERALDNQLRAADVARIREQAVYYLGRLQVPNCPAVLIKLAATAGDPLLRRAAALGAILHGEEAVEFAFIDELLGSPEADLLNRSVQLSYFGDVDEDMFAFSDDGRARWAGVRTAIFDRLKASTERDLRLRLWDLATLLGFLKSRPEERLVRADLDAIGSVGVTVTGSQARRERVEAVAESIIVLAEQRGLVQL